MKSPDYSESSARKNGRPQSDLSPAVEAALSTYIEHSDGYADSNTRERAAGITKILAHYAPDRLSQRAFDAAALHPLAEQIHQPNQRLRNHAAGLGLKDYFTWQGDGRNSRSNGYVGTLLGDTSPIKESQDSFERRLDGSKLQLLNGNEEITERDWIELQVGANIPEIDRISRITNIESLLACAADTMYGVMNPGDDNQELMRNIQRTSTFYARIFEILGYYAAQMEADSRAACARVEQSGNHVTLDYAKATLDQAKNISPEVVMGHYFGNHPSEHLYQTPEESLCGERIVFSSTSLDVLTDGRQSGELNTRFKTVGKYALKLLRNPSYSLERGKDHLPADVFGMLAVLPDARQLGAFFADSIKRAQASPSIDMTTSASKTHPIFIQGSSRFVREVCQQIPNHILNEYVQIKIIDDLPEAHIYQVAKFTSNLYVDDQALPVEFQLQTKADRANARLGIPSHMNHDAGEGIASIIPGAGDTLRTIFARKDTIDPYGEFVNPLSIPHGERFRRWYMEAVGRYPRP